MPNNSAFVMGDTNANDAKDDVFMGQPFTTFWDALGHYEPTGKALTIDVIAKYARDGRVEPHMIHALQDDKFKLFGDHASTVGNAWIDPVKA